MLGAGTVQALVIADLHLSAKARDAYRFEVMATVAGLLEKHKPQYLIILGDLTEEKDYHPAPLVNDVVDIIHSFSKFCQVIVLRGNHDYTRDDFPFFRFLRRLKNVRWVNAVSRLQLDDADCLFLPHTRTYEKDWAKLPQLEEIDWIFAHNTFEGSITEHGKKLSGIPTSFFDGHHVISGDIHTPQDVGPVTFVGAPYTVDFGDDYEPRALLITGTWKTRKEQSIPLPGPQKRLLEFDTSVIGKMEREFNKGDIIKARVKLTLAEQEKWFSIRDKVKRELTALGAVVHLVQPVTVARARTRSVKIERLNVKKDETVVQEYGKQISIPAPTLKVGLSFLKEA